MILVSPARVGLVVLLLLPAVAAAQQPAQQPTFSGSVDVQVTEIEVLVTDRGGRPVAGLSPQDFRVLEDGQPVEITNLSPTSAQPLVLAVFLDETSLSASARANAIQALRRFFASDLRAGDRVLLVHYTGALELGEPTGDVAALGAVLDRMAATASRGGLILQERSSLQREILQALPPGQERDLGAALASATNLLESLRRYGRMRADMARATLAALQQTLALFASLPERKALVFLSGGLPMSPGADLYDLWNDKYEEFASQLGVSVLETASWDATRQVQDAADRANAAGITLHVVALPEAGAASAVASGAIGARSGWDPEDSDRALRNLAAATGGRVETDLQNPAAFLAAAGRDIGSAYLVGYTPPPGEKKGRHKIQVTVRDGELLARYREERFDGAAGDPLLRRAVAALWAGAGANPLKAELAVEEQTREEDGRYRVTAIVSLPLAAVLVQPQEHFHVAHLTVAIVARDGKGHVTGSPHAEFPVEIPNEGLLSAPGQTAGYRFTVYLAPGDSVMAVALRDDASGAESVLRLALTPGAETAAGR
jgi:VWFA-related protein